MLVLEFKYPESLVGGEMGTAANHLIQTILIPVAFMAGFWRQVGRDPEAEAVDGIATAVYETTTSSFVIDILATYRLMGLLVVLGAIAATYVNAGVLGLGAFGGMYVGGYLLLPVPEFALIVVMGSFLMAALGIEVKADDSVNWRR